MNAKEKVIEYITIAERIFKGHFPHGDTSAELALGTIEIAKMLQREELDGIVISGTTTPHME